MDQPVDSRYIAQLEAEARAVRRGELQTISLEDLAIELGLEEAKRHKL
ncbi:hypothetical protein JZY91_07720 [Corynebacterium sp. CNCTC7651]|nr:hypothetical protein [Corynebacterium sp. CNCTC7651]UIZ91631.1 hypothetical protein JZY91_07720 [Corynebacterium sp. CNCTC7651]